MLPPKFIANRDFKKFDNERFMNSLQSGLFDPHTDYNNHDFEICQTVFDIHAPQQKKYIRENHKPLLNKRLSKAIMQRTLLRNKFPKHPADENRYIYTKQRYLRVSLLRKEKKIL